MRRPVVAGNWKMHGSSASIAKLLEDLLSLEVARTDVLLFPPFAYLAEVVRRVRNTRFGVGAQNIHADAAGAFTGEVAAEMVSDVGATHVLVGHSERRQLFGESDALIARKFSAAMRAGLVPILCVGETLTDREGGRAEAVVTGQLNAVLDVVGVGAFENAMVAYEPVWAIGTGRSATPVDAQAMHAVIRARLGAIDAAVADRLRVLYGGSVNAENARALFAAKDVDGGLVGGASLNARQFMDICRAA
ncbi:MAG TPA: triose-phosphate isomerase [Pseudomonadales bacterium]